MKRYESKNHPGVFATIDGIDEKYKTAMLQFDDGKTQPVTVATLKRWWTLVDDNYDPNANTNTEEVGTDDNASEILVETEDDISDIQKSTEQTEDTVDVVAEVPMVKEETPEESIDTDVETVETEPTEVETEPAEVEAEPIVDEVPVETPTEPIEKPKRTRKKNASGASVDAEVIATFREQIENALEKEFGLTKVSYAMDNVTLFRAGKKTVIRLYYGKRNLVFHTRPEIVPDGVEYNTYKYFLSAVFHKDYSDDTMSFVKNLISVYKEEKANN